ncbi:MAG: hypothetical protein JWL91_1191 [Sphingomonas bacterium]|nr:phage tail assembly chaperone [Sphingomonas bacterium]MDB5689315.1 hypothetical protein [Sphingomonas bacterium]
MSDRFADAAERLAGLAAAIAGWRPDEFWRATPAELATILRALGGDGGGPDAAGKNDLDRLKELFPDG